MKQIESGARSAFLPALFRKAAFALTIAAGVLVLGTGRQAHADTAPNATAVMQKMIAAYQALNSYEGRANTEDIMIGPNKQTLLQRSTSVLMQYRKPNRLKLAITTPFGDRNIYSDNREFTVYDSMPKTYTRTATSPTMAGLLTLLLQRASIGTEFDPLYFISMSTLPREMILQKAEDGQFSGHPVSIVTGQMHITPQAQKSNTGSSVPVPATTSTWTWTIDKQTNLMRRVEVHFPNVPQKVIDIVNKKPVQREMTVTRIVRITINDFKPNTSLDDTVFHFRAPDNAKEVQITGDGKSGKK